MELSYLVLYLLRLVTWSISLHSSYGTEDTTHHTPNYHTLRVMKIVEWFLEMLQRILDFCRSFCLVIQKRFCYEDSRLNSLDKVFTSFNITRLHVAVMYDDIEFAQNILYLRHDLAIKKDSNGFTPLHIASARTSLPMVKLLLETEPDACMDRDEDGRTPLHLAAMKNRVENMQVLMEHGRPEAIHLNQNGETILHFCVRSNSEIKTLEWVINKLVLAQHLDPNSLSVNSRDNDGNTILHLAAHMGNMKIINYLLESNDIRIDINVLNNNGLKALDMLSQAKKNDLETGIDYFGYRKNKFDDQEWVEVIVNLLVMMATVVVLFALVVALGPRKELRQDVIKVGSGTDPITYAYYLDHMHESFMSGRTFNLLKSLRQQYSPSSNSTHNDNVYAFIGTLMHSFDKNLISNGYWSSFSYLLRYAGYPVFAFTYPDKLHMVTNAVALVVSLTIIVLVKCGFMKNASRGQVRVLSLLVCISYGCLVSAALSAGLVTYMTPNYVIEEPIVFSVIVYGGLFLVWAFSFQLVLVTSRFPLWSRIYDYVNLRVRNYLTGVSYLVELIGVDSTTLPMLSCIFSIALVCTITFRYLFL